jgi:predicted DNA-binding protein (MmcQ/YjbR family)
MSPDKLAERFRKLALTYPETYEEAPWGDRVVKVKGKIFLFCGQHEGQLYLSVKLPRSGQTVLKEPWATPTAYGLGKSGWVSAKFKNTDAVPEDKITGFIDESYRAVAPKKLAALLDAPAAPKTAKPSRAARTSSAVAKPLPRAAKLRHKVVLLCEDKLRAARARDALAKAGVTVELTDSVAAVRKRLAKLDAAILDVGRSAGEGLTLAAEIDGSDHPIHLFIVGIRDARSDKRAATNATSAERFRSPPGDDAVVAAVAATLSSNKPR